MRRGVEEEIQEVREERKWRSLMQELRKVSYIAMPMVAINLMQHLFQVMSVMMVGHLGQLSLSSVAIANSITNVTGFSLLTGLAGGLDTLCGQAYGAQEYRKLANYTYGAIISLVLTCIPLCIIWIFMDKLLILTGQDPSISVEARKYSFYLIPALFGGAVFKPLTRYLQSQSLVLPLLTSCFFALCLQVALSWVLIFKLKLGSIGAAISNSICTWLNVICIGVYIKHSAACKNVPMILSIDAFLCIGKFFRLAVPSAVMVCLKWWALEVLVLLSGFLPNPKLETSVLSICFAISNLHFMIPHGIGAAASTRVSNELGAGKAKAAQMAVCTVMLITATETAIVCSSLYCSRHLLGHTYSNDRPVVNYIAVMTPWICASVALDSFPAVISGIARGSGWQHIGAYVNLGSFYLIGLPVAIVLGFVVHMKAKGFWIGIVAGTAVQSAVLSIITALIDWQKQVTMARERILIGRSGG